MAISFGVDTDWAKNTSAGRNHIATKGIIQTGLVYNLDFGAGSYSSGTAIDLIGNQNATIYNAPTNATYDCGGSLILNGSTQYIRNSSLPLASPLSVTTNFTIEQVFRITAYQTSNYFSLTNLLLSKGSASTFNYCTQVTNDTTFSFIKRTGAENLVFTNFTVPSMKNLVKAVTIVVNGTNVSCYVNGTFISSASYTGAAPAPVNGDPLYIGSLGNTTYTNFTGSYYIGRIYNRSLSSDEVLKNFNSIRARFNL